jgi:hypothetical protein
VVLDKKQRKMNNVIKYNDFINENFLNATYLDVAFDEAKRHFKKIHEKITEDHVIDFMVHYIFNFYGIDLSHTKDTYKLIKQYVHHKHIRRFLK